MFTFFILGQEESFYSYLQSKNCSFVNEAAAPDPDHDGIHRPHQAPLDLGPFSEAHCFAGLGRLSSQATTGALSAKTTEPRLHS